MVGASLAVLVVRFFHSFSHVVFNTGVLHNVTVHSRSFIISSSKHQQLKPEVLTSAVTHIFMHVHFINLSLNILYSAVDTFSK